MVRGQWAVVRDGVYFTEADGKTGAAIEFFGFATRRVTRVSAIERLPARTNSVLTVSPDEKWLVYTQSDDGGAEIVLVDNFR